MPSITITFKDKLSEAQFEQLADELKELIRGPYISFDYQDGEGSYSIFKIDKGRITEKTPYGYIVE